MGNVVAEMTGESSESRAALRVRRARRGDISSLVGSAGGPPAGRLRALRRLLKTLSTDTYVIDRDGSIDGVVVITYRRSLTHGGVQATIDCLDLLSPPGKEPKRDLERLIDCALERARRRGCVGIDSNLTRIEVRDGLLERGFEAGPEHLGRSLRLEEKEG